VKESVGLNNREEANRLDELRVCENVMPSDTLKPMDELKGLTEEET
jgi:hypothetical protein